MTIRGYARVSTTDQSVGMQMDALRAAGVEVIYTDVASGAQQDRPELDRMMAEAQDGDSVVVWRLDRLGRSTQHLLRLVEEMRETGVAFRSLTEGMDTTSAGGMLIYTIFSAMAEFERCLIVERTNTGLKAARERGRVGGRPRAMDQSKADAAQRLIQAGRPMTEVARTLGVSRSTLYRWVG